MRATIDGLATRRGAEDGVRSPVPQSSGRHIRRVDPAIGLVHPRIAGGDPTTPMRPRGSGTRAPRERRPGAPASPPEVGQQPSVDLNPIPQVLQVQVFVRAVLVVVVIRQRDPDDRHVQSSSEGVHGHAAAQHRDA